MFCYATQSNWKFYFSAHFIRSLIISEPTSQLSSVTLLASAFRLKMESMGLVVEDSFCPCRLLASCHPFCPGGSTIRPIIVAVVRGYLKATHLEEACQLPEVF